MDPGLEKKQNGLVTETYVFVETSRNVTGHTLKFDHGVYINNFFLFNSREKKCLKSSVLK